LSLMESSAIMFEVVHNEHLVSSVRLGERSLESLCDGRKPSLAWDWNLEIHRVAAKQLIEEHLEERQNDASTVHAHAKSLISLMGGSVEVVKEEAPVELEDEVALLLALVSECNLIATYMDRDYLFEVQVKAFSVFGLEHPHQGYGGRGHEPSSHHGKFHHHHQKRKAHHGGKEDACAWVFVDSVSDLVPDALWPAAKFAQRVTLVREAYQCWLECGEDGDEYVKHFPPDLDPFYDPPRQKLLGVAYVYLASLNYLIPINESPQIVSFKGEVMGELEVEVHPMLDSELMARAAEAQVFHTEEPTLKKYCGELLHLRFRVRQAHGLPRKLSSSCFVTFPFFMEGQPLRTGACGAKSTAPKWDQSITVEHIVTDDFIDYILNEALEIEVWGGPDNHLSGEDVKAASLCGDKFEFAGLGALARGGFGQEEEEEEEVEDDDNLVSFDGSDAEVLKDKIAQLQASLDEARREAKLHSDLAMSLVNRFDGASAQSLGKGDVSLRVPAVLRLSHDRISKLEAFKAEFEAQQSAAGEGGAEFPLPGGGVRRRPSLTGLGNELGALRSRLRTSGSAELAESPENEGSSSVCSVT